MESKGLSFCEALNEKFCTEDDFEFDNMVIQTNIHYNKQNLEKRKIIGLDHCNISKSGGDEEIKKTCPLVQELDLSSNQIEEWSQILNITKQLEHLTFFNISHNPLDVSTFPPSNFEPQNTITKLALNHTQANFKTTVKLLDLFPSLSELHLSVNDISEVPDDINKKYENLETLHLAKNNVSDWSVIKQVGKMFPNLLSLNISENPIEAIPADNQSTIEHFEKLEKLNIMETKINDWESIDNLKKFSNLKELRIKGAPIYEKKSLTEKQTRLLTVARLPKLEKLNGSIIETEEREDGERMFIRFHMQSENKPPRYDELINLYGKLEELIEVNFLNSFVVCVLVKGDIKAPFLYELDSSMTVQTLYKELGSRLKLTKGRFDLVHLWQEEDESSGVGNILESKCKKPMSQYHVRAGDSIKVILADLEIA